jgi:hypothetical protein
MGGIIQMKMTRRLSMIEVGEEVTVINDKGIAYTGYVMATATSADAQKAYKIAVEGGGLQQLAQWHKASNVFMIDPPAPPRDEPIQINQVRNFLRQ